MKSYILTIFFFGAVFQVLAQSPSSDDGQRFIKKKCGVAHVVHLPLRQSGQHYSLLFDSIRVLDFRSDTSRLGIVANGRWSQEELLLRAPVGVQLMSYLNAGYTAPTAKHRLLVVIKNLWVSDPVIPQANMFKSALDLSFRFEAYLPSGDDYVALTYLDTAVTCWGSTVDDIVAKGIPDLIARFMDKTADHLLLDDLSTKRVVSYGQIDSFARSRFDYAMDTATMLVKGVYTSVHEFRNNTPSILKYEISKDKGGMMSLEIPDENGQMYYTHKVWGYCDGRQAYVMMDGNVFPVFCVDHQFYVLGSKDYQDKQIWVPLFIPLGGALLYGTTDVADNVIRKLRLFRLDVRSGRVIQ